MTKSSMSLLDRFLFRDRGVVPTKRLLFIIAILSIFITIGALLEVSWTYIIAVNLIFFSFSFLDLFFIARKKELHMKRHIPNKLERGKTYKVEVALENTSNYPLMVRFIDDLPLSFSHPFPRETSVKNGEKKVIHYETLAKVRGDYTLQKIYVRFSSIFQLWERQAVFLANDEIKVLPNLSAMKSYLEDAQRFLLYEGVKIRKAQQGTGEFAKVRSYTIGDDPRLINWRQTAKLQEVMVNDYEPEQGKIVTILIDCGRMMGAELREGNRLEKVLEAALTVVAAALARGDYVSVLAFSKEVKRYIPPAKGMAHLQTILDGIYNLEVDDVQSNYGMILNELQSRQSKRSLLLLFSDIQAFLYDEIAMKYLTRLRQHHLFLFIGIENEEITKTINNSPMSVEMVMMKSVAQKFELKKVKEKRKWERAGLMVMEAKEEHLATVAVSQYIDLMNRGLL